MANPSSWFESGYEGADREQEKRDLGGGPKRWWMAAATTKEVVFVDDTPVCFDEHQWKTAESKFPNWATCIAKISQEPCAGCTTTGVGKADYTGHLTMIDITGYISGKGTAKEKHVRFELVEFTPKLKVMNKLKFKKANAGSLIGQLYKLSRADSDAPNSGDDLDFQRAANMEALYKAVTYRGKNISEMILVANGTGDAAKKMRRYLAHQFQIPDEGVIPEVIPRFNYMKLHEPMDSGDLRRAVAGAVAWNSNGARPASGGHSSASAEDDVPF